MYKIPEKYRNEVIINKNNFIPKTESINNKKKIKDSVKKIKLIYQLDKDIKNYIDDNYNVQVVMFIEVELKTMKYIDYINQLFHGLLKAFVIIKYVCGSNRALGYGRKRLNKQDKNEVVLESSFVTKEYEEVFFLESYQLYEKYLDFDKVKNKNNKLEFYMENMVKAYVISNRLHFKKYEFILKSKIYYTLEGTLKLYEILEKIIGINIKLKNKNLTSEKIDLNKKLVSLNNELEELLDGGY